MRIIKALSRTEDEKDRFSKANEAAVRADRQAEMTMAVANPMMGVLLNIAMAAVIVAGAFRVDRGLTEPGKIIAFLNYFVILQNGLLGITRIFTICSRGIASGKRLGEVLEAPERVAPPPPQEPAPEGHVVFSHVSFSYNKVKPDIDDLSFTLARGQTLGIIGPTGSGKSTLLQLLLRFYEFTTRTGAMCWWTDGMSAPGTGTSCTAGSAWSSRTISSSRTPSWRTWTSSGP